MAEAEELLAIPNVCHIDESEDYVAGLKQFLNAFMESHVPSVRCSDSGLGIQRFDDENGAYVHVLNYAYNVASDSIQPVEDVDIEVRDVHGSPLMHILDGILPQCDVLPLEDGVKLHFKEIPLYLVIEFEK